MGITDRIKRFFRHFSTKVEPFDVGEIYADDGHHRYAVIQIAEVVLTGRRGWRACTHGMGRSDGCSGVFDTKESAMAEGEQMLNDGRY